MADDIEELYLIGKGGFGKVHLCRVRNKFYALKTIRELPNVTPIESDIMKMLPHPLIMPALLTFGPHKILMPLMLCTMQKLLKLLDKQAQLFYNAEIVAAMTFVHSRSIVHGDISLDNIMIDVNQHIKLGDFGAATYFPEITQDFVLGKSLDWKSVAYCLSTILGRVNFSTEISSLLNLLKGETRYIDGDEIKLHSYFRSIDWLNLSSGKVPAPVLEYSADIIDIRFTNVELK